MPRDKSYLTNEERQNADIEPQDFPGMKRWRREFARMVAIGVAPRQALLATKDNLDTLKPASVDVAVARTMGDRKVIAQIRYFEEENSQTLETVREKVGNALAEQYKQTYLTEKWWMLSELRDMAMDKSLHEQFRIEAIKVAASIAGVSPYTEHPSAPLRNSVSIEMKANMDANGLSDLDTMSDKITDALQRIKEAEAQTIDGAYTIE